MSRTLPDWLTAWETYVEGFPSPKLLCRWTGIAIIAGSMERKCWIRTKLGELYPNLYTFLLAPPAAGKTILTKTAWYFWSELKSHKLAPSSISKAALIDSLEEAKRQVVRGNEPVLTFNSLLISANELGVLLPSYENDFMNTLTDIYDCYPYSERRRHHNINIKLPRPQFNILAAAVPAYLNNILPEGAWDQGFLSRVMMIYSGESHLGELELEVEGELPEVDENHKETLKLRKSLIHDLKLIGADHGKFSWTKETVKAVKEWRIAGPATAPDHPKLTNYCARRSTQLLKLCMVASMVVGGEKLITLDHFDRALSWLMEAESAMPDIFKAMKKGGDGQTISECYHFVYKIYIKRKEPIQEFRIIRYLQDNTPTHNIERIIDLMVKGKLLVPQLGDKSGKLYIPGVKNV